MILDAASWLSVCSGKSLGNIHPHFSVVELEVWSETTVCFAGIHDGIDCKLCNLIAVLLSSNELKLKVAPWRNELKLVEVLVNSCSLSVIEKVGIDSLFICLHEKLVQNTTSKVIGVCWIKSECYLLFLDVHPLFKLIQIKQTRLTTLDPVFSNVKAFRDRIVELD